MGEKFPVLRIQAKGVMTKPAITVLPNTKLKQATKKMRKFNISSLVVVKKRRPVGILTKRDLLEPVAQTEKPKRRLTVQFSVKNAEMDEIQRSFIMDDFRSFARRHGKKLEDGTLFAYLKTHGTNFKGDKLFHCRLQLRTVKGSFFSSSEGFGVEQAFSTAIDRLESQILRSTEPQYDREFTRRYLRRIRFPLTEL